MSGLWTLGRIFNIEFSDDLVCLTFALLVCLIWVGLMMTMLDIQRFAAQNENQPPWQEHCHIQKLSEPPQLLHCSCINENRPEDYQTSSKCSRWWHRWCWRWSKTSPLFVASNCVFKLSGLCKFVHYNLFYFEPVYQSNPLYAYWSTDRDCLLGKPLRIPIFIALHNKTDINTSRNFWCARAWHW